MMLIPNWAMGIVLPSSVVFDGLFVLQLPAYAGGGRSLTVHP